MKKEENIDQLILEALNREQAEFYEKLDEQSMPEMLSGLFRGKLKWITIMSIVMSVVWVVIGIYCILQFFDTTDLKMSKEKLEDVSGTQVNGYRAPSYSFTRENDWAHDVLLEQGYLYSSSIAPIKHDLYGIPDAPRFSHRYCSEKVLELPITTVRLFNKNYPCGGGGWFRLYPYPVSKWAIDRVNRTDQEPAIFYFHPWEIDPGQPKIDQLDARTRFRHYQNLQHMEGKIVRLLGDYDWQTIPQVYAKELAQAA